MKASRTYVKIWDTNLFQKWQNLKEHLAAPKDKEKITRKSGVTYWFRCGRLDCVEECIG